MPVPLAENLSGGRVDLPTGVSDVLLLGTSLLSHGTPAVGDQPRTKGALARL